MATAAQQDDRKKALNLAIAQIGELNQVWTNLIHNAVQAMGGSGEILIETSLQGGDIKVAIQDSGPGIPPEAMSRIFDPFFTTKGKGEGTGLGLSIAHKIVEKHGGKIRVESVPGQTRFEVLLPVAGAAAAIPVARPRAYSSGRVVLTVDSGGSRAGDAALPAGDGDEAAAGRREPRQDRD